MKNAKVYKKIFPGAFIEDIEHYVIKILENKNIDAVILNVGINNIVNGCDYVRLKFQGFHAFHACALHILI